MTFEEINLDHKTLFNHFLKLHSPQASEMTFINFYMWRKYYNFKVSIINDLLCIIGKAENNRAFACVPFGNHIEENYKKTIQSLKSFFNTQGLELYLVSVPEQDYDFLKTLDIPTLKAVFDRDNSDYVYNTQDLITLKGKKYDAKRNHINKFKKLYEYEYIPLTPDHLEDCIKIMDDWYKSKVDADFDEFYHEKEAYIELIKHLDLLGAKGAILKVNGHFEGFTIGEMLNAETAAIHVEKANWNIQGIYPFINQQFCENAWANTSYINREQDLGIEGLRKAKLSYNPALLINKYNITI